MYPLKAFVSFVGRILLVGIFLASAIGEHLIHFQPTVAYMESRNIPNSQLMLIGALAFMIVGGLLVLFGFCGRLGAALLGVFLILAMYYVHNFWTYTDPVEQKDQMIHFMKNLSMLGAMVFIVANGTGAGSLARRTVVV